MLVEQYTRKYFNGTPDQVPDDCSAEDECTLVGPTLVVKPGQKIVLTLYNELPSRIFLDGLDGKQTGVADTSKVENSMHDISVTAMHTHGLHVSSAPPGDSIFTAVKPQANNTFVYDIPANHMGGTFWYHAHHHGSTSIHAGGGAAGMIIIEEPPSYLPPSIAELTGEYEMEFAMVSLDFPSMRSQAQQYEQNCKCVKGNCKKCGLLRRPSCELSCHANLAAPSLGAAALLPQDPNSKICPLNSEFCNQGWYYNPIDQGWHYNRIGQGWRYNFLEGREVSSKHATCLNHPLAKTCQDGQGGKGNVDAADNGAPQDGLGVWAPGPTDANNEWTKRKAKQSLVLINGDLTPDFEIVANVWYRWRLLFAAVEKVLEFGFCHWNKDSVTGIWTAPPMDCLVKNRTWDDKQQCKLFLLSKDGIILNEAPRKIEQGLMAPGSRADVLVNCPEGKHQFTTFGFTPFPVNLIDRLTHGAHSTVNQSLMTLHAKAERNVTKCNLPTFKVARPCYLVDLQNVDLQKESAFSERDHTSIDLTLGSPPIFAPPWYSSPRGKKLTFEGQSKADATPPVGQPIEIKLSGIGIHPFHLHINPFQLQGDPMDPEGLTRLLKFFGQKDYRNLFKHVQRRFGAYFKAGDWQDTLLLPLRDKLDVRSVTDFFNGTQIWHCHILSHEDQGMMGVLNITGEEGTTWPGAKDVDPFCYEAGETAGPPNITGSIDPCGPPPSLFFASVGEENGGGGPAPAPTPICSRLPRWTTPDTDFISEQELTTLLEVIDDDVSLRAALLPEGQWQTCSLQDLETLPGFATHGGLSIYGSVALDLVDTDSNRAISHGELMAATAECPGKDAGFATCVSQLMLSKPACILECVRGLLSCLCDAVQTPHFPSVHPPEIRRSGCIAACPPGCEPGPHGSTCTPSMQRELLFAPIGCPAGCVPATRM